MRIAKWLGLILCIPLICAEAVTESEIAPLYKRAVHGDKQAVEQCITLLETEVKEHPNNQVVRVYLGSAYALRSRDMSFGLAKLSTFRRAMELMDSAVATDPENPRVHLVRGLTCDPLPSFLGRKQIAHDDFARLAEMAKQSPEKFTAGELNVIREHTR